MPKQKRLTQITTIRYGQATAKNLEKIQDSGIASDSSAAFRAATAALAHALAGDPRVWVVDDGNTYVIFSTQAAAHAWLEDQGAVRVGDWWEIRDGDGDAECRYDVEAIVPR